MRLNADVLFSKLQADLASVIDLSSPSWSVDSTSTEVAAYNLRSSFLKKFNSSSEPSPQACRTALEKFQAVNKRCGEWVYEPVFTKDEELIGEVKSVLDQFWHVGGVSPLVSDYRALYLRGRAGPGASLLARGTDFYTKMFDSPLSATRGLPEVWERCVTMDDRHFLAEARRLYVHSTDVVDCSKYSFVNKTVDVARGICTEPTINMWFQLGLGSILEDRLAAFFGIRLDQQPDLNRALAHAGSVDDSIVTIDLESASDSLSTRMLQFMLPKGLMDFLSNLRCPATMLPTGRRLELNMVSTMGNGFTFPLQTMLFSAIVRGVNNWHRLSRRNAVRLSRDNFGVFGDDIICPRGIERDVIRVLNLLGFVVNTAKSFVEGPFRESCGADFFKGVNVRGVYIKSLNTEQDTYIAINSLNRWSARTGIYLNAVVTYLFSSLRRPLYVPLDEGDDAGIHTPRAYMKTWVKRSRNGRDAYRCWTASRYEFIVLGGHVWTYPGMAPREYNPPGLLLSLLFGSVRGCRISIRQRKVRYVTRQKVTPRWDYLPPRPIEGLYGPHGFRRVVDAWHWNLLGSSAL
ncbi:RNA-directed RNA polymerase [ssRNA phage SRR7976310_2]|uniref:RNA-directed RNA polymerase n=1 Tax=ssRNA phage SRR7976310_2 TaxID=2786680 RepID=A0A8S5L4U9_9VIRU|nr:RNA-directed RNA polymerase [ssRNA phage SRR7976310_2]DAD52720.1 TPA_asm: RNA-directed RNA polymerase [ssRNA phage SRR7976310_2]